ncbi:DUF6268 family outer membrane beta-barrel protein [Hymenobacter sp. BT491]|uniref:DUF6268 family outer membrane beta-barrel protein n=1 Tax=Hymenobacter sp. BT491 TaxID=2766779 RepID=UPI0016536956|nr:DUF6268 family outer membrane beta-barrel protein [Hymenobacter sp. BT491]MBC6991073.1 hypothetical protein [Hymenobacter sp. BT491]
MSISTAFRRSAFLLLTALAFGAACPAYAQVTRPTTPVYPPPAPLATDTAAVDQVGSNKEFATPTVVGMGPSKGVVAHLEGLANFSVKTDLRDRDPAAKTSTTAVKNRRAFIKGYIPVWNHPHLKVILGFNYDREEFQFAAPDNSAFYRNLEDKGLKTLGTQLAVIRPIDEVHWFLGRVKGELNGDYTSSELTIPDYLKVSGEFFYGWKRSATFSWGVGLQLGYTFGRQSIYPAVIYNRTFNDRWGVEALFPARVTVRRNLSPRTLLLAGYTVDGLNYNINLREKLANGLQTLIVRETEVKGRLRLEREIYDFIWFGLEGGYRYNYSFNAFDKEGNKSSLFSLGGGTRPKIISNSLGGAPYAAVELFLVPPRKFLKKTASE